MIFLHRCLAKSSLRTCEIIVFCHWRGTMHNSRAVPSSWPSHLFKLSVPPSTRGLSLNKDCRMINVPNDLVPLMPKEKHFTCSQRWFCKTSIKKFHSPALFNCILLNKWRGKLLGATINNGKTRETNSFVELCQVEHRCSSSVSAKILLGIFAMEKLSFEDKSSFVVQYEPNLDRCCTLKRRKQASAYRKRIEFRSMKTLVEMWKVCAPWSCSKKCSRDQQKTPLHRLLPSFTSINYLAFTNDAQTIEINWENRPFSLKRMLTVRLFNRLIDYWSSSTICLWRSLVSTYREGFHWQFHASPSSRRIFSVEKSSCQPCAPTQFQHFLQSDKKNFPVDLAKTFHPNLRDNSLETMKRCQVLFVVGAPIDPKWTLKFVVSMKRSQVQFHFDLSPTILRRKKYQKTFTQVSSSERLSQLNFEQSDNCCSLSLKERTDFRANHQDELLFDCLRESLPTYFCQYPLKMNSSVATLTKSLIFNSIWRIEVD